MKFRFSAMPLALSVFLGLSAAAPLSYLVRPVPMVSAATQKVSVDGIYIMSDGLEESQHIAKIRARQDAMRMAAEQAGVYVKSYSKTVNNVLTEDETLTLSSAVLHVDKETFSFDDMGGQGMKLVCHIEADVETVDIDKVLQQRREDAQQWEILQAQNKNLREQTEKIRKENEALKAAYEKATTEKEQQRIQAEAKKNQDATMALDWFYLGNYAYHKGQYESAIQDYTQTIYLDASYADAYTNRGASYDKLGQYENAVQDFTEAIRLTPTAAAYCNRGIAYAHWEQYDKAIQDDTEAIRQNPSYVLAYVNRGLAYHALKQYEKAIQDYTEAIRLKPDYAEAYTYRGEASIWLNTFGFEWYEKALRDYAEAIRLRPNFAETYLARGNIYYGTRQYTKAIQEYTEAIQKAPNYALAYRNRGKAHFEQTEYAQALQDAKQANQLQPGLANELLASLREQGYQ